jgi:glycosyltransferase involved in cell wall biosynthesis
MKNQYSNVISIGYGRNFFNPTDKERARMMGCAQETAQLHMVIFTHRRDGFSSSYVGNNLWLHPTNSRHRLLMILDSFLIAQKIITHTLEPWIVTTQDPFEAGIVGALLKWVSKSRLVVQEHGDVFSTHYWRQESFLNQVRYRIGLWILKYADAVRVVSERSKKDLEKRGIKHIIKLPVAIDMSSFVGAQSDPIVQKLFGPNTFVFLSVARFVPQKNIAMMIAAFKTVYTKHPHVRLLLVGSGYLEPAIKTMLKKEFLTSSSGECPVQILSWSANVAGLMKACDAYLLSSNYEGWGRVLIEAMVSALPIVTTDVGCAHEVIIDGVHGLITPVNDQSRFTAALLKISEDTQLYRSIKNTLSDIPIEVVMGADSVRYGKQWVQALQ